MKGHPVQFVVPFLLDILLHRRSHCKDNDGVKCVVLSDGRNRGDVTRTAWLERGRRGRHDRLLV